MKKKKKVLTFAPHLLSILQRCYKIMYSGTKKNVCAISDIVSLQNFLETEIWWLSSYHNVTLGKQTCLPFSHFKVLFFGKRKHRNHLVFALFYCEMTHMKDKRKFTLFLASNSDFISANVIINKHSGWFNFQNIRYHQFYTIICVVIIAI